MQLNQLHYRDVLVTQIDYDPDDERSFDAKFSIKIMILP